MNSSGALIQHECISSIHGKNYSSVKAGLINIIYGGIEVGFNRYGPKYQKVTSGNILRAVPKSTEE